MDAEKPEEGQTVILRGNKIERVGSARETAIPSGATLIEGRGKHLLPGLADMHVHLAVAADPPGMAEAELILFLPTG
jgi:imidazolonepropionase-like amidohydrolase